MTKSFEDQAASAVEEHSAHDDSQGAYITAAPDAVVIVDEHGIILSINDQASALLGYGQDELVGQPVERLVPDDVQTIHKAHRTRYRADPHTRPMGDPGSRLCAIRADGAEVPVEIALSPVHLNGRLTVMAVMRDVRERVAAELEHELVRLTLDAVIDGVFMFEADSLAFTYVNEGAALQTGYTREELTNGMTPLHIKPEFTAATFRNLIRPLVDGSVDHIAFETIHRRKDGIDIPVDINLQYPAVSIGPDRLVAIVRDITDRKATEERLRTSEQRLVVTEDRERIARDLHDVVIQRLFASGMQLQAALASPDRLPVQASETIGDLDETISVIRETIFELTQPDPSLARQIHRVVDRHRSIGPTLIDVRIEGDLDRIPPDVGDHLIPALNEALANVHRHAGAERARVDLEIGDGGLTLVVADDGIGINEGTTNGFGLTNLEDRAAELAGTMHLTTGLHGRGTGLRWEIPFTPS